MVQDLVGESETRAPAAPRPQRLETRAPLRAPSTITWSRDSILFSSCNEDSGSELRAFGDLSGKQVLCITAGGGRVLNLLHARPALIWAVDLNPVQNYLLELKVAGMRALDHEAYLRFLGVRPCTQRLETYRCLHAYLSDDAQRFFDTHSALISEGVLFQGRLERYLRRVSMILQWTHPFGVRQLFACEDIASQRKLLHKIEGPLFRVIAETACRRNVLRAFSGDPGFYRYVPREVALHRVILAGVLEHFRHYLARNNPLMQLVFFGRVFHEPALPAYLNAASYAQVQRALEQVRLVTFTGTVNQAFSQAGPATFDALSLSDISSYLDDYDHAQLFAQALEASRPGARLCSRSNIHHRTLLPEHAARLRRDPLLETELAISDHSCVHKFVIGAVR